MKKLKMENIGLSNVSSFGIKYLRFQVGNGPFKPLMQPMDDFDENEVGKSICAWSMKD